MVEVNIKPFEELPEIKENTASCPFVVDANTYNNISYEDFFNNHLRKNIPCIIKNVSSDWEASKKWVSNGTINYDYLSNQYGELVVPVTDCKKITFDNHPTKEMKLNDYITYWKSNPKDQLLYLKDWHLKMIRPDDEFYKLPQVFASDWLNEYAKDRNQDDFMFVYMGPSKSWTPLHADVYRSYSWSVNVVGRKKWFLFPPGEEDKLKDSFKSLITWFEPEKFKDKNVVYYEIIQGPGDAIFVPSNWHHQVENEIDTISVNHNWINGCNLKLVWQSLTQTLTSVEKEIDSLKDLPEFPSVCQNLLKQLHGMDFYDFATLLTHIGDRRLVLLDNDTENIAINNHMLGKNHCMYDLKCIQEVVHMMEQHPTYINDAYKISESFVLLQDCLGYVFK